MKHLILSREFPPAAYVPGGIGTYVANISRLMAERGEEVHVIAERWEGAPLKEERLCDGRLVVHRIGENDIPESLETVPADRLGCELSGLKASVFPHQWFAWHAAFVAERLVASEEIDTIEGQEWEAPLYYFLLRRSLGLGPDRTPPCIVHLHSPTRFIRHFNGSPSEPPAYSTMRRMEEFCIGAADAFLCPSQYFAAQSSAQYGLPEGAIKVVPLPVGETMPLARTPEVWANGSICFVGRIEPRKGVVEWIEAAMRVAADHPGLTFDFVGADIWRLQKQLLTRVPPALRSRFRFHGSKSRSELAPYLSRAMAGVVPSRWENFPNVCIEAMGSGLPVIATCLGGMVEMIEDGRTGWLTPDTGVSGMVEGLEDALRRCLATSPEQRAAMGAAAAEAIARFCDNGAVTSAHISFRQDLGKRFAARSAGRAARPPGTLGAKVVVSCAKVSDATRLLRSLEAQTVQPRAIAIVHRVAASQSTSLPFGGAALLLHCPATGNAAAWNAGHAALAGEDDAYWLFLDADDELAPDALARMGEVLDTRPDVAIVSPWTERTTGADRLDATPSPDAQAQLIANDVAPASAFRGTALGPNPPFRPGAQREYDVWELANRVLAAGGSAVTLPEALLTRHAARPHTPWPGTTALRAVRAEVLSPLLAVTGAGTLDLVFDYVPLPLCDGPPPADPLSGWPLPVRLAIKVVRLPRRIARALWRRVRATRQDAGALRLSRPQGARK